MGVKTIETMPSPKQDARTTRWAAHREQVRADFVAAAIRTFDRIGPTATLDDICAEVGVKKPKLYRFFGDKNDLYRAILDTLMDDLWDRLAPTVNLADDSARALTFRAIGEYADVVAEHPNVFHFLASGQYGSVTGDGDHPLRMARGNAERAAELAEDVLEDAVGDPAHLQMLIYTIFGMAASAADWWIRTDRPANDAFTRDEFVEALGRSVLGVITANLNPSVTFDPDEPLHLAFTRTDR
ncbi:TetR/AcrR family transcriptional regulator [Gordonia sp. (in: high G+C Gram-positive bacteria)]|uniref:TetR/AcrR family transcriptional regulator n=1 Tax=Gordonia sp. (in: high G+C Gram-positive bacteria) TaxID=84139 RepID=UPI00333E85F9